MRSCQYRAEIGHIAWYSAEVGGAIWRCVRLRFWREVWEDGRNIEANILAPSIFLIAQISA